MCKVACQILQTDIRKNAVAKVERWADADVDAAATALRKLYDDPVLRAEIGIKAKRFISDYFSVANFKADIERFLDGH